MDISFDNNTLNIDDEEFEFEEEIHNVLEHEDRLVEQFKQGSYHPRNLVAVDHSGNVLWRVETLEDQVSGKSKPVNMVKEVTEIL